MNPTNFARVLNFVEKNPRTHNQVDWNFCFAGIAARMAVGNIDARGKLLNKEFPHQEVLAMATANHHRMDKYESGNFTVATVARLFLDLNMNERDFMFSGGRTVAEMKHFFHQSSPKATVLQKIKTLFGFYVSHPDLNKDFAVYRGPRSPISDDTISMQSKAEVKVEAKPEVLSAPPAPEVVAPTPAEFLGGMSWYVEAQDLALAREAYPDREINAVANQALVDEMLLELGRS